MRLTLSALALIAGCDQVYGLTGRGDGSDGSVGVEDAADAPLCTLDAFDSEMVIGIGEFLTGTYDPAMSGDGLEMFYAIQSLSLDLRYAIRASKQSPWLPGFEPGNTNDPAGDDADPTITADGRSLLFTSTRTPTLHSKDVYEITREIGGAWSAPVRRMGIDVVASSIDISADGRSLFVSEGTAPSSTLYKFERTDIGKDFDSRMQVGVGTSFPSVSADGSELFFHDADGIKREVSFMGLFVTPEPVIAGMTDADLSHDRTILTFVTPTGLAYLQRGCATSNRR